MKPSNYNFFFPYEADDDKVIAYNSFSNALALMEKDKHIIFDRFCKNGDAIEDEEFIGQLKMGSFLIDDDVNELERLRFRMLSSRYNTDYLSLTIAPTADCNFRCSYCYEKDVIKPDYMTEEVQNAIIAMVQNRAKTISHLHVTWYGGEPLMSIDAIENLSKEFIDICDENNITYNANIITNGYLLTEDNVKMLNNLKVTSMQVTIDGGREVHDVRRPFVDGSGTFDTIIQNLIDNKGILPPIGLRINIDKDNLSSAKEMHKILIDNELTEKVNIHLGKVVKGNEDYDELKCFNTCDFSREEFSYYTELGLDFMWRYPRSVSNVCAADSINSHIIGADGRLYKCWADIGNHERCVGSLKNDAKANDGVFLNYILFDPTVDNMCSKCNLLPVCMGGCPYKRLNNEGDKCSVYMFVLEDYLAKIAYKMKIDVDASKEGA